jgi:hypothetical protein
MAMKTVNDLIEELQKLNNRQKNLPLVVYDTEHNLQYSINNVDYSNNDRIDLNLGYGQ